MKKSSFYPSWRLLDWGPWPPQSQGSIRPPSHLADLCPFSITSFSSILLFSGPSCQPESDRALTSMNGVKIRSWYGIITLEKSKEER